MKKMLLLMLLLALVSGPAFAAYKTVSVQFTENPGNQVFAGGQLIGPYNSDSSNWNSSNVPTTGDKTAGTLVDLIDSTGEATGIDVSWSSSNTWWGADGTADDQHKLAVGYLDDGGDGVLVTLTNVPYANYKICGLYTSGQGDTATVNFDVNGAYALGGDATTIADVYGSINSCNTNTGSYWTQIETGVTRGNYWVVDASGDTCTINGELRNGTSRGSLAGIIIVTEEEVLPPQRSISTNFQWSGGSGGWGYHWYLSRSSIAAAGYISDPCEGNGYFKVDQAPTATWNEGTWIKETLKAQDDTGSTGSAIIVNTGDFKWGTSWYTNLNTYFDGSAIAAAGAEGSTEEGIWDYKNARNKARMSVGFIGHNGGQPLKPLTSINKMPYSDYMAIVYMHPNQDGPPQEVHIEDQAFYYLAQPGGGFRDSLRDPNGPNAGFVLATETEAPATKQANVAIFRHLSAQDMVLMFDAPANSGISAYSIISEVNSDDIVKQITPGNIDKDYGGVPAPLSTVLSWEAPFNGADSYDVYIGEYNPVDTNNVIALVESGNTAGSYAPVLNYNTAYVWRVDTVRGGETFSGDYFYFDTEGDPLLQIQPRSVSVELGSDTFFDVGTLLTDNYAWYSSEDAAIDTPEDDVLVQDGPDAQLNIAGVAETDVAYYYVVLTNTIDGSAPVTSDVVSLEIGKLELYVPFDDETATDPCDLSDNGFALAQGNPDVSITYATGFDGEGKAASFIRGSGDQLIVVGSEDYFNFYPKGFTIRMWVKPVYGFGGFTCYAAKGNSGWRMQDTAEFYGQGFEAKIYPLGYNTTPGRLDDGNWHMVACTYDGATQEMKVYQEGRLDGTVIGSLNDPSGNTNPISIGSYDPTGTGGWAYEGLIDEFEVFSYPISEMDMIEDYAAKTGEVICLGNAAGDINDDCKVNTDDLAIMAIEWLGSTNPDTETPAELATRVVSWQFDETDGLVATDSSGNGIDGTLGAGFTTGQWIADGGRTGTAGDNALYIDGSANTSVIATVADPAALSTGNVFLGTSSWTMNIWVKYDGAPTASVNIGGFGQNEWLDPSTESDRYFASYGDYAGYEVELGQTGIFPSNPIGEEWQMLTATYDGTTCVVYYNGEQLGQTNVALVDTLVNEININTARRVLWDAAAVPMKGTVDDFSIWGQAFTSGQVAGMYANSFTSCDGALGTDMNGDCVTNLEDFVVVASDWLDCGLIPSSLCD